jgi:hypothetical protein
VSSLLRRLRRRRYVEVDRDEFRRLTGLRPGDEIPADPTAALRVLNAAYEITGAASESWHSLETSERDGDRT